MKGSGISLLAASAVLFTCAGSARAYGPGISPTAGVQITVPQKLSVSAGISTIPFGNVYGSGAGMVFRLQPGLAGGKVQAGLRSAFSFFFLQVVSLDITGSLLYTWGDPWGDLQPDQTYLGGELRACTIPLVFSTGVYRHVAGGGDRHEWLVSAGAGIGF